MKKIAWIGTGVMGNSMVSHLIDAGYPCSLYNRTKEKMLNLKDKKVYLHNNYANITKEYPLSLYRSIVSKNTIR